MSRFQRLTIIMSMKDAVHLTTVVIQNTGRKSQPLIVLWNSATPAMAMQEPSTFAQVT